MTFKEALRASLEEYGISILRNPERFRYQMMESCGDGTEESEDWADLIVQCDRELLSPYALACRRKTPEAVAQARETVDAILAARELDETDGTQELATELGDAIEDFLRLGPGSGAEPEGPHEEDGAKQAAQAAPEREHDGAAGAEPEAEATPGEGAEPAADPEAAANSEAATEPQAAADSGSDARSDPESPMAETGQEGRPDLVWEEGQGVGHDLEFESSQEGADAPGDGDFASENDGDDLEASWAPYITHNPMQHARHIAIASDADSARDDKVSRRRSTTIPLVIAIVIAGISASAAIWMWLSQNYISNPTVPDLVVQEGDSTSEASDESSDGSSDKQGSADGESTDEESTDSSSASSGSDSSADSASGKIERLSQDDYEGPKATDLTQASFSRRWVGTYEGYSSESLTGVIERPVELSFSTVSAKGELTGICRVADTEEDFDNPLCSYRIEGTVDWKTGDFEAEGTSWIYQGDFGSMRSFEGKVSMLTGSIDGTSTSLDDDSSGDLLLEAVRQDRTSQDEDEDDDEDGRTSRINNGW